MTLDRENCASGVPNEASAVHGLELDRGVLEVDRLP